MKARLLSVVVVVAAFGLAVHSGLRARTTADSTLRRATEDAAVPFVTVVSPTAGAPTQQIRLPGTTQAYTEAPIFARTSGYLRRWYFDIGARVKAGDLMAEIETPEVDQQLQQARADLETAQANLRQAQITADRWEALWKTDSVSKQETVGEPAHRDRHPRTADGSQRTAGEGARRRLGHEPAAHRRPTQALVS